MAAFNGSKWILEQVDSILCQVNVDVQLIVSDDGSQDETRAMISRLRPDQRVHVVSPDVPTRSAAQNFLWLIRRTPADEYDYVSLADQDDIWGEAKISRGCMALAESHSQGYSSSVTAFWRDGRTKTLEQVQTLTASDFLFEGAGQGCTYILDQAFYQRLRTFLIQHESATQTLRYHDWAIYAIARSWKLKWVFDQKPGLRYRQHDENDTGARTSVGGIRIRLSRIKSGWYSQQLLAIATTCLAASPGNPSITMWHGLLTQPRGIRRIWRIASFCSRGGRRRWYDRVILMGAVVVGWI